MGPYHTLARLVKELTSMAPLPPNNTKRVHVDYTTGRRQHTMQVRGHASSSPVGILSDVFDFLNTIKLRLPTTWEVTGVRYTETGGSITLPIDPSFLAGFSGENVDTPFEVQETVEWVWVGRGLTSGRRVEISLYGILDNVPGDFRFNAETAAPWVAASIAALNAAPEGFATIVPDNAQWYPYVNVNYNSYWETRSRRGA